LLRGSECGPCRRAGHYCPAALLAPRLEGEGDEPMCLECADGELCVAVRCAGLVREESSACELGAMNVFGDIDMPGNGGKVVHRTPEELGIPAVVRDVPQRKALTMDWAAGAVVCGSMRLKGVKKDAPARKGFPVLRAVTERSANRKERIMVSGTAAVGGGRANNRVPSKRYGMPVVSTVAIDEVPEPVRRDAGIAAPLYAQIAELRPGLRALRVDFETEGHASYVLTKLRRIAKKEGAELLSSKSGDGKTRFFWLEKL